MAAPTIVWFRQDLRLADNPALNAAIDRGEPVIPVYIWSPEEEGNWSPGGASMYWLHLSLAALARSLEKKKSRLILRHGPAGETLASLARECAVGAAYWNRRYEPEAIARDKELKGRLSDEGIEAKSFNGSLLNEPWTIETGQGTHYKVFTPYYKACLAKTSEDAPLAAPKRIPSPNNWLESTPLDAFKLEPTIDWAGGIRDAWTPGEAGARKRLDAFLDNAVLAYKKERDRPDHDGTSRLSPYLHFGELSPRQILHAARERLAEDEDAAESSGGEAYIRQLYWREFAFHLLYHEPQTTSEPLRDNFREFPWNSDKKALKAWQKGQTGYPYIDAAMRELWTTGWMHNRARMAVASFLVKHLLISWQEGAKWFWDTLVDADLANNTLGWQWTAGCGADAAPYFRIFNPMTQGEKFDPDGVYVRRWVPELAELPDNALMKPWEASDNELEAAGVTLGKTYPNPIVDHREARERALAAYETIKKS